MGRQCLTHQNQHIHWSVISELKADIIPINLSRLKTCEVRIMVGWGSSLIQLHRITRVGLFGYKAVINEPGTPHRLTNINDSTQHRSVWVCHLSLIDCYIRTLTHHNSHYDSKELHGEVKMMTKDILFFGLFLLHCASAVHEHGESR